MLVLDALFALMRFVDFEKKIFPAGQYAQSLRAEFVIWN